MFTSVCSIAPASGRAMLSLSESNASISKESTWNLLVWARGNHLCCACVARKAAMTGWCQPPSITERRGTERVLHVCHQDLHSWPWHFFPLRSDSVMCHPSQSYIPFLCLGNHWNNIRIGLPTTLSHSMPAPPRRLLLSHSRSAPPIQQPSQLLLLTEKISHSF